MCTVENDKDFQFQPLPAIEHRPETNNLNAAAVTTAKATPGGAPAAAPPAGGPPAGGPPAGGPPGGGPQPAAAPAAAPPPAKDNYFPISFFLHPHNPTKPAVWKGKGFNTIWRPNSDPKSDHFLELNLTNETLTFTQIPGNIPNRGLLQHDIDMFGITYLQSISDANLNAGLHLEPGIWARVPPTQDPLEPDTVVRMGSIPHGTVILAQGTPIPAFPGPPPFAVADITPFVIGNVAQKIPFPQESVLTNPSAFRSSGTQMNGITQGMVDNPNSVLSAALAGHTVIQTSATFIISTDEHPVPGGGTANTAFLKGTATGGKNAEAAQMTAIFWIEQVQAPGGKPPFLQLQYTQNVLLNFAGLSWPHITVATLVLQP